jgi:hypothetical protein
MAVLVGHWLSRIDPAWLVPVGFDPRQLPAPPRAWGLDDPWRTLFATLGLATALALALSLLLAFTLSYLLWRTTTLDAGEGPGRFLALPMLITEVLYLTHRLFPFVPALLPEIVQLAGELGAAVVSADPGESRAGLMNRMLAAGGAPLIAMFDGNFMPLRPFLRRTLGFFSDGRVAMVQTPPSASSSRSAGTATSASIW